MDKCRRCHRRLQLEGYKTCESCRQRERQLRAERLGKSGVPFNPLAIAGEPQAMNKEDSASCG